MIGKYDMSRAVHILIPPVNRVQLLPRHVRDALPYVCDQFDMPNLFCSDTGKRHYNK